MKGKIVLIFFVGIVGILVALMIVTPMVAGPLLRKKLQVALNEKYRNYLIQIDKVSVSLISSTIEIKNINLASRQENEGENDLNGEIESVKFKGVRLAKALFRKNFDIDEVIISNYTLKGKISFPKKAKSPGISRLKIRIGKVLVDKINIALIDSSTSKSFSINEGILKVHDIKFEKQDTLNRFLRKFDFEAEALLSVSADSLYTYKASKISYSDSLKTLSLKGLSIQPNYTDYAFAARHKYESDRVEAEFGNVFIYNFPAGTYFQTKDLTSSYIEIGQLDMRVFRDKRKEFEHIKKPTFQEMMYNYPGLLRIDSIGLTNANIVYSEHVEKATEPGMISMNELQAKIYNITNDTIYKTEDASFKLVAKALLMGKGKITTTLKAKLFDKQNSFSLIGTLSAIEAKELNPMLEKNAFVYATSGKIEKMNFDFAANNSKATGQMTMIYNGLDLAVKNKRTDDTTAIVERIVSIIANKKALNSNPLPGEKVRIGIIDYNRDPERFVINYCFESILTGIKSSIVKNQKEKKEKKTLLQKIFGKADDQ